YNLIIRMYIAFSIDQPLKNKPLTYLVFVCRCNFPQPLILRIRASVEG
ncbi:MAG: hypothetical protein ACI92E_002337, partial [Oceanicoccus sp.]